ncbi:hypothetical protein CcrJ4_gp472c [Caulobacter phage J4]|nr:hypothetical protein CcrJ4_gp472c [Caulobacter phage J4]UTU10336.1 hypothetical protein CcrRB23_gp474c [Caulobacter phage RB23]UXY92616.1 hypothetical protein CcrBL47_gp498c [Caulobacter phage BL47]
MVSVNHLESFMPRHVTHVNKHDMGHDRRPIPPPRASPSSPVGISFPRILEDLGIERLEPGRFDHQESRSATPPTSLGLRPPFAGRALIIAVSGVVTSAGQDRPLGVVLPGGVANRVALPSPSSHRLFVWTMQAGDHSLKGCLYSFYTKVEDSFFSYSIRGINWCI